MANGIGRLRQFIGDLTEILDAGAEEATLLETGGAALRALVASDDWLPPEFAELANRIAAAEDARGASRVDPPQQDVIADGKGGYRLAFEPRLLSEDRNAALSLGLTLSSWCRMVLTNAAKRAAQGAKKPK